MREQIVFLFLESWKVYERRLTRFAVSLQGENRARVSNLKNEQSVSWPVMFYRRHPD